MSLSKPLRQKIEDKWLEVSLALSAIVAGTFLARYGEAVFDWMTATFGKKVLLEIASLLVFSCAYLGWRVYRHGKKKPDKPEIIRIVAGIEFHYGDRTGRQWLPFCPKCKTAIYAHNHEFAGFTCHAGCGWRSPIPSDEIWEIAAQGE